MFIILGGVLGAGLGALTAYRRKGSTADILQYAFVYGLAFTLGALFVSLIVHRISV